MEPAAKRLKQHHESFEYDPGSDDDEQLEQLEYELFDWWVLGPPGPLSFAMKLNVEDELKLSYWCLECESRFSSGFILDSEPLLFRAQRDEERWGF